MLQRLCSIINEVAVDTTAAACDAIPFSNFAGGMVYVPATAGASITGLTWYASHDGITYLAVYDGAGVAVTTTIAHSKCCLIPAACFGAAFLKAVGNAAGTIILSLKS